MKSTIRQQLAYQRVISVYWLNILITVHLCTAMTMTDTLHPGAKAKITLRALELTSVGCVIANRKMAKAYCHHA
jgi:hypothetical protein